MTEPATDPLEQLRERIRATQEAAEQLLEDGLPAGDGPQDRARHEETAQEAQALVALLQMLRESLPPELAAQVRDVVRQLLLLVRALIDWWVDRLEPGARERTPAAGPPPVQDIPIA